MWFLHDLILRQTTNVYFGLLRTFPSSGSLYVLTSRSILFAHPCPSSFLCSEQRLCVSTQPRIGSGRVGPARVTERVSGALWTLVCCHDELIDACGASRGQPDSLHFTLSISPSTPDLKSETCCILSQNHVAWTDLSHISRVAQCNDLSVRSDFILYLVFISCILRCHFSTPLVMSKGKP